MIRIGVDIGGSHISAAQVTDADGGGVGFSNLFDTEVPGNLSADALIDAWAKVILKAIDGEENVKVGIAMPGPFDYEFGISKIREQGKMSSLYQKSIKNLLSNALGVSSEMISFTNDAEAFLIGESMAGAARSFTNSIGITLGTGLGSAIKIQDVVKDARLWTAPFRSGIAEDFLGTAWFVKESKKRFDIQISGVKDLVSPKFNPEYSNELFYDFGRTLGEFLLPYLLRMQIEGVVIGGKVSQASEYYLKHTESYLSFYQCDTKLVISSLGEKAALLGSINSI